MLDKFHQEIFQMIAKAKGLSPSAIEATTRNHLTVTELAGNGLIVTRPMIENADDKKTSRPYNDEPIVIELGSKAASTASLPNKENKVKTICDFMFSKMA
jgi:hypothetical protein